MILFLAFSLSVIFSPSGQTLPSNRQSMERRTAAGGACPRAPSLRLWTENKPKHTNALRPHALLTKHSLESVFIYLYIHFKEKEKKVQAVPGLTNQHSFALLNMLMKFIKALATIPKKNYPCILKHAQHFSSYYWCVCCEEEQKKNMKKKLRRLPLWTPQSQREERKALSHPRKRRKKQPPKENYAWSDRGKLQKRDGHGGKSMEGAVKWMLAGRDLWEKKTGEEDKVHHGAWPAVFLGFFPVQSSSVNALITGIKANPSASREEKNNSSFHLLLSPPPSSPVSPALPLSRLYWYTNGSCSVPWEGAQSPPVDRRELPGGCRFVADTTGHGGTVNNDDLTAMHGASAVKFSPLMGGCLLVRLSLKNAECNGVATRGFGFAWLLAGSMGLN